MSDVEPTFETVFTSEYWEPFPKEITHLNIIGQLKGEPGTKKVINLAKENLILASNRLVDGEEPQRIKTGELIGGNEDVKYALPGAVMLLDEERVWLRDREVFDSTITSEEELKRSALSTFHVNKKRVLDDKGSPYDIYDYYYGRLAAPTGVYVRAVGLYAFYLTKKNKTASFGMSQFRNLPANPEISAWSRIMPIKTWHDSFRVEETMDVTRRRGVPSYYRVKSAYLCLRGIAETSKASRKDRKALKILAPTH